MSRVDFRWRVLDGVRVELEYRERSLWVDGRYVVESEWGPWQVVGELREKSRPKSVDPARPVSSDVPQDPSGVAQLDVQYSSRMANEMTGDTETDHGKADDLLCELLRRLGFERTVMAFEALEKWYA